MSSGVGDYFMIRKFLLTTMLAISVAGGVVVSAAPVEAADAQTPSIGQQVAALLAQYPNGGAGLEGAISLLISGSADPSAAAAQVILAMPATAPSSQLASVGDAINGVTSITASNLEAALASAIEGSIDPVSATQSALAEAPYLGNEYQAALGRALATAVANIGVLNPTAAAAMQSLVASSNVDGVKTAFAEQQSIVGSINNPGGTQQNSTTQESGRPAVSPN